MLLPSGSEENLHIPKPVNMRLGTLFQFLTGKEMDNAHQALSDVKAMYTVFRSELFWNGRSRDVMLFSFCRSVSHVGCLDRRDSNELSCRSYV
jgi:hypothetical protein